MSPVAGPPRWWEIDAPSERIAGATGRKFSDRPETISAQYLEAPSNRREVGFSDGPPRTAEALNGGGIARNAPGWFGGGSEWGMKTETRGRLPGCESAELGPKRFLPLSYEAEQQRSFLASGGCLGLPESERSGERNPCFSFRFGEEIFPQSPEIAYRKSGGVLSQDCRSRALFGRSLCSCYFAS